MGCSVENCDRVVKYKGKRLCSMHYQRLRTSGVVEKIERKRICWVCDRPAKAYGWCELHWQRLERTGTWEAGKWSREHSQECVVPRCLRSVRCMGLCSRHYSAERKRGHPLWRTQDKSRIQPERPWSSTAVVDLQLIYKHNEHRREHWKRISERINA